MKYKANAEPQSETKGRTNQRLAHWKLPQSKVQIRAHNLATCHLPLATAPECIALVRRRHVRTTEISISRFSNFALHLYAASRL